MFIAIEAVKIERDLGIFHHNSKLIPQSLKKTHRHVSIQTSQGIKDIVVPVSSIRENKVIFPVVSHGNSHVTIRISDRNEKTVLASVKRADCDFNTNGPDTSKK